MFNIGTIVISNLPEGDYTVVITDANGCTINCSNTVEAGACMLTIDPQVTHISCEGGSDGTIELWVGGALGNVTYEWNPASIGNIPNPENLGSGSYSVTVTDQFGCSNYAVVTLADPETFTITCSVV